MLVKIEARILIFPGTDFHFPSTSVPPGTFFRLWGAVPPLAQRGAATVAVAAAVDELYRRSHHGGTRRYVVSLLTFIPISTSIPSLLTLSFQAEHFPFLQILPIVAFLFFMRTDYCYFFRFFTF